MKNQIVIFPENPEDFWERLKRLWIEMSQRASEQSHENQSQPKVGLMKPVEVCKYLRISKPTLDKRAKKGVLKKHHVGREVYYLTSDVENLFKTAA